MSMKADSEGKAYDDINVTPWSTSTSSCSSSSSS